MLANYMVYYRSDDKTYMYGLYEWLMTVVSINRICMAKYMVYVRSEDKTYMSG
jgi:hypothetical protein